MAFSYLKKLILLPIPILLVFGFFCHASFAQGVEMNHDESHTQHQQGTHNNDCGTLGVDCVMQHNHNQLTIATVQGVLSTDQITKKVPNIIPVFLVADYSDKTENKLGRRLIFHKDSSPNTNPYHNWPVGLARSHLS